MKLHLSIIPDTGGETSLASRLTTLTLLRLVFLAATLAILGGVHLRDIQSRSFSVHIALAALGLSFGLAAAYGAVLRSGKHLRQLGFVQLVFDQLIWTSLVYVSGGPASGATSLYGLTTLTGAVLGGLPAAAFAAGVGFVSYLSLTLSMVAGVLPKPPDQGDVVYATSLEQVGFPVVINVLVLLVVTLLAGNLAERLRLTGGQLAEATSRIIKAERFAQLGQVAAGLAHEIRNPLGSIAGSIELLRSAPGLGDDDRALCDIIQRESSRLNDLVGDMLDLTRPKRPEPIFVDLGNVAREVVILASRAGRSVSDVTVGYDGPHHGPILLADSGQLRQLLWNLVRNAVQASAPGTHVVIRVYEPTAQVSVFEVVDRGQGILPEARDRLFDAFFTTSSHGSGIGLAVVKRIADDHGWSIDATNNDGAGTCFRITVPTTAATPGELSAPVSVPSLERTP